MSENHNESSDSWVIMGSSNISDSGLGTTQPPRYELNVAMKDYDDVAYCKEEFRKLWEVDDATDTEFRSLVLDIQNEYSDEKAKAIDQRIFDLYGLTSEKREAIGYIDFHSNKDDETDEE